MSRPIRTLTFDEPKNIAEVVKHEYEGGGRFTRKAVTLKQGSGAPAEIGLVLGKVKSGAATSAAKVGGNTGNGVLTLDATTPVLSGGDPGVYQVRFFQAAANAGSYEVYDPSGILIGVANVGQTFANRIKFSIADGGTDFIVGDGFDITVAAGSLKYVPWDPTAQDGSEDVAGVLLDRRDATAADQLNTVALVRGPAEIVRTGLVWGSNVTTTAQKDAAVAALEDLGIICQAAA